MPVVCPHCRNPVELTLPAAGEVACPACGSTFRLEAGPTTDWVPMRGRLGRFELLGPLGFGSFGSVLRARDPELDRVVALKVPRPGTLGSGPHLDRFLREARSAAQLRHPSIVTVHEVGQADGVPFLVSDLVEGVNLADWLSAHRPSFRESARLVAAVADALHYAHERGVVHRDVKPSNIMIAEDGKPCVMDFGLAKRDAGEVTMTLEGQVLGTPAYMSPEQARGDAHQVDGRSDVYSLGVVLYQMLTGELPFRGTTRMLLHQVLHDDPRPLRALNDRIPRDLETVCLKAMDREPGRRYATAGELAGDLRRFLDGEPVRARPVGRVEKLRRWCRRNPAVATLLILVVAVTAAGFGGVLYQLGQTRAALAEVEKARGEEAEQRRRTAANQYLNTIALASREHNFDNLDRVAVLLEQCPPDRRGWEWNYLHRQCQTVALTFRGHQGAVTAAAFGPGGRLAVSGGVDGVVRVWEAESGREVQALRGHTDIVLGVGFRPDGRQIASAGRDGAVLLWDLDRGGAPRPLRGHEGGVGAVAYSPDGTRLATGGWDASVRLWDPDSGRLLHTLTGHTGSVTRLAFDPAGGRLASGEKVFDPVTYEEKAGTVRLWDVRQGKGLRTVVSGKDTSEVAFSPDGTRLAVGGFAPATVYDVETGEPAGTLPGPSLRLAYSPDGRWLAAAGSLLFLRGQTFHGFAPRPGAVAVADAQGGPARTTLRGHTDHVTALAFSPDGGRLLSASGDGTVKVWASGAWQTPRLHHPSEFVQAWLVAGDTRLLAAGAGRAHLWDAETGRRVAVWRDNGSTAPSADGRRVAHRSPAGRGGWTVQVRDTADGALVGSSAPLSGLLRALALSPDGRRVAVLLADREPPHGGDGTRAVLAIWDVGGGAPAVRVDVTTVGMEQLWFSPDGRLLARANGSGSQLDRPSFLHLHDAATGAELRALQVPRGYFLQAAFSPDATRVAVGGLEGSVHVWETSTGRPLHVLGGNTDRVDRVTFSPDGRRLAAVSRNQAVVWEADTGRLVQSFRRDRAALDTSLAEVAFSPDGSRLVTTRTREPTAPRGSRSGRKLPPVPAELVVWDVATGQEVLALPGHEDEIRNFAFSTDGSRLVSAAGDGSVRIWDARPTASRVASPTRPEPLLTAGPGSRTWWGPDDGTTRMTYAAADGSRLLSGGRDGTARVWSAADGRTVHLLRGHAGEVNAVAVAPDGAWLATGGADGVVKVWDARTGRLRRELPGDGQAVQALAPLAGGTLLAVAGPFRMVRVWDVEADVPRVVAGGAPQDPEALAVSPDGKLLAWSGADGRIRIREGPAGKEARVLTGHAGRVTGLAFSPDGKRLASAGVDRTVRLWDMADGTARMLRGPVRAVCVAFRPDGGELASGGDDGAVRLWDAADGTPRQVLWGHAGSVTSVAYRRDGRELASSGNDGTVELWDLTAPRQ